jgi:hypothetical protein
LVALRSGVLDMLLPTRKLSGVFVLRSCLQQDLPNVMNHAYGWWQCATAKHSDHYSQQMTRWFCDARKSDEENA